MSPDRIFSYFMPVWVLLGIASSIFFWRAPLEAKRRWHPRLMTIAGTLFGGLVAMTVPHREWLLLLLPAVALISFLNIKFTKFCESCGSMVVVKSFRMPRFCERCGAPMDRAAGQQAAEREGR